MKYRPGSGWTAKQIPGGLGACRWRCSPAACCPRWPPPDGAATAPSAPGATPRLPAHDPCSRDSQPRGAPYSPPPSLPLRAFRAAASDPLPVSQHRQKRCCVGGQVPRRETIRRSPPPGNSGGNGDRVRQWLPLQHPHADERPTVQSRERIK